MINASRLAAASSRGHASTSSSTRAITRTSSMLKCNSRLFSTRFATQICNSNADVVDLQLRSRRNVATGSRSFSISSQIAMPRSKGKGMESGHEEGEEEDIEEEGTDGNEVAEVRNDDPKAQTSSASTIETKSEEKGASSSSASPASTPSDNSASSGSGSSADGAQSSGKSGSSSGSNSTSVSKQSVPTNYPQVLALPITRRPLFPGFYKAVVVKNPAVCAAIRESLKRGQPYIGAFLLKDEEDDADVITDLDKVHRVGVFAQITSIFSQSSQSGSKGNKDGKKTDAERDEEEGLTAVLYPHRRIRIDELITPKGQAQLINDSISSPSTGPPTTSAIDVKETRDESENTVVTSSEEPEATTSNEQKPSPIPYQTNFLQDYAVSLVNVTNLEAQEYKRDDAFIKAIKAELIAVFKDIALLNPLFRDQIANFSISQGAGNVFEEPDKLADFAAAVSSGEVGELQSVLETLNIGERLQKALLVLKKELMNAQLQNKISKDVEQKIQKRQREYYLTEQLKGIKKELGIESDGKDKMVEKFKEKANSLRMPEPVRKVFDEELNKLQTLEPAASEFNVTRGYLEWLTNIPWGVHSPENYSIANATSVLDHDHYGLKDVKDRILEFLAVGKLRGTVEGKIICLVGPPGVGKTSIGKSIARAVQRQFFRFSVGGLSDVAEIKGHRRTYVGAMPGKAIQALKKVGTENPLVLIDEVDKIGRGHNGDPSSALLEMLDPEQNGSFLDHYMDVPVDLSRVLFVCTANTLDTIPQPLLDRMEVIEVSSYTAEEKKHIAKGYLAPQAKDSSGLKDANVQLADETIEFLIRHHARESGVRQLRKLLEKVYRKIAFNIVRDHGEDVFPEPKDGELKPAEELNSESLTASGSVESKTQSVMPPPEAEKDESSATSPDEDRSPSTEAPPKTTTLDRKPMKVPDSVSVEISIDSLRDYIGPPVFHKDRLYDTKTMPAGVCTGLGYLGNGSGSLMPIETTIMPGKGGLQLTGKLGEVIKESASIALSWLKSNAKELEITKEDNERLLENKDVHLHMPEGAIGKEGPSAGVAFITSLVSLLTNRSLNADLAMTGEVSLRGMVLPVGGLKEKLLAAHRAGIAKVILPSQNRPNVEADVPRTVLDDLEVHYVNNVWSALEVAFGEGSWSEKAKELEADEEVEERRRRDERKQVKPVMKPEDDGASVDQPVN
ncbi:hypothetical protein CBS101457_001878 [Exobasidium rhododendri]|nr:hypothetical protein CBS101457_001878 [Exobasidium rhododendri]